MSRRPTRLTLDGKVIAVRWPKRDLGRFPDGYRVSGDQEPGVVRIGPGQPRYMERATLVHELLHEVIDRAGLKLPKAQEEYILNSIDVWVYLLIRENPELVEYLAREDG